MARNACHTCCWNAVPRMSSGRSRPLAGRLDQPHDLSDHALERAVAADELGAGKAILEIARQRVRIVAEQDGAHALVGRGDQHGAERGLADREADRPRPPLRAATAVGVMPSRAVAVS